MMTSTMSKSKKQSIMAVAVILAFWQGAAVIVNNTILLVSPLNVIVRCSQLIFIPSFWQTVAFSFVHVFAGYIIAVLSGMILAVLAGRFKVVSIFLQPIMQTIKTVPIVSFIVLCLVWLSSADLSIFIVFLMVLPIIYSNLYEGIVSTDKNLLEMAHLFNMSGVKTLIYVYLPHLKPFLLSAFGVTLGLAWKAGIAAEIIAVPDGSIGDMIYHAKVYLNTTDMLSWTLVVVVISVITEKLILKLLHKTYDKLEKS